MRHPSHWYQQRAAETRAIRDDMTNIGTRAMLARIAEDYDCMADWMLELEILEASNGRFKPTLISRRA